MVKCREFPLIEIDDVPIFLPPFMVGIFHGYVSHNQMVS